MQETEKTKKWARLRFWLAKHRKTVLIVGSILIFLCMAGSITAYLILSRSTAEAANKPAKKAVVKTEPKSEPVKYYSPLTGALVTDEAAAKKPVTGIMIENSPDSRPQSGIKNSGVVFEAIAEGGITRFLVLYQQEKPQIIGPVRSIRLYDVDWAAAFDCSIGHVGGSAAALAEIRNGSYRDIDQFFNSSYYWRAADRYAPHNVYTSSEKLDALNTAKGYTESNFTGFSRVDGKASSSPTATNISITISSYLYNSTYQYNSASNTYARYQAGEAHSDREDGQITPSVVIAMRVNETSVLEDGYRENIVTTGSGDAKIFQNGIEIDATWHKDGKTSQITFTDANGADIPLVRGQTWIAAVPNDGGGVSWQ